MEEMIALEPALAARIVAEASTSELVAAVRRAVKRRALISIVGAGTSEHAAMIVAALLAEAMPDAAAGSIQARESLDATLDPWPGLCIAISHEGGTASTARALAAARGVGAETALITAAPDGEVGRSADIAMVTPLVDRSWCHTVGYVSPIAAAVAVAGELRGESLDPVALERLLDASLAAAGEADEAVAGTLARSSRVIPVGSGIDHAAARELALKLEEGAALPAAARDTETLLHGHLAAVDETAAMVFIVADPRVARRRVDRAAQGALAAAELGAPVVALLSADADARWPADAARAGRIVLPDPGHETQRLAIAALGTAVALQRVALATIHARGTNPDLIRREDPRHQAAADIADRPLPDDPAPTPTA